MGCRGSTQKDSHVRSVLKPKTPAGPEESIQNDKNIQTEKPKTGEREMVKGKISLL